MEPPGGASEPTSRVPNSSLRGWEVPRTCMQGPPLVIKQVTSVEEGLADHLPSPLPRSVKFLQSKQEHQGLGT